MKIIWAILCQTSVIDSGTNNISLFNVIEEVTVPAQPPSSVSDVAEGSLIPSALELVILWTRSDIEVPERGFGRLQVIAPQIARNLSVDHEVDLSTFLRLRARIHLPGLPAGGPGIYLFKIDGKPAGGEWTQMFELPLRVVLQSEDTD